MSFARFFVRRISQTLISLFGLSILIFVMVRVIPGDPVHAALGMGASEEAVRQMEEQMRLHEPLYIQYYQFLIDIANGQLGISLQTRNDVATDLVTRVPVSLELMLLAIVIAIIIGVPLGVISGITQDRWPDHVSRIFSLTGVSFPRFWLAILLQVIFVGWLALFPLTGRISVTPPPEITGMYVVDSLLVWDLSALQNTLWHLFLPALALAYTPMAQITRLVRSDMIEVNRTDYIMAARSYGLPDSLVHYKYMLKNSFSSSLTLIGLSMARLLGGAFYIEIIFNIDGLGAYAVGAVLRLDLNAIVGVTLVIGFAYLSVNAVVDLLYGFLDPRIRDGEN